MNMNEHRRLSRMGGPSSPVSMRASAIYSPRGSRFGSPSGASRSSRLTASLMDDLEPAGLYGDELAGGRLSAVLVVAEVMTVNGDGDPVSTVIARVTNRSSTLGLGLIERGREAFLSPDDE